MQELVSLWSFILFFFIHFRVCLIKLWTLYCPWGGIFHCGHFLISITSSYRYVHQLARLNNGFRSSSYSSDQVLTMGTLLDLKPKLIHFQNLLCWWSYFDVQVYFPCCMLCTNPALLEYWLNTIDHSLNTEWSSLGIHCRPQFVPGWAKRHQRCGWWQPADKAGPAEVSGPAAERAQGHLQGGGPAGLHRVVTQDGCCWCAGGVRSLLRAVESGALVTGWLCNLLTIASSSITLPGLGFASHLSLCVWGLHILSGFLRVLWFHPAGSEACS